MLFGEMLDDERREGYNEGHQKGHQEERRHMTALIEAMCADGREKDLSRISSEPEFLDEMLKHYHIVSV